MMQARLTGANPCTYANFNPTNNRAPQGFNLRTGLPVGYRLQRRTCFGRIAITAATGGAAAVVASYGVSIIYSAAGAGLGVAVIRCALGRGGEAFNRLVL